jgi:capsular polysaccharide export protein
MPALRGPADPWHLAEAAVEVWADADDELGLVAQLLGKPARIFAEGSHGERQLAGIVQQSIGSLAYQCPFDGHPISAMEAVRQLGHWRRLIDSNRDFAAVVGIAAWKRPTADNLLWDGSAGPRHVRRLPAPLKRGDWVAAWMARSPTAVLETLAHSSVPIAEVEDGMIRGPGLGANCVPPLSLVVDRRGIYFDPSKPSDLELILESADFDSELLARAARLRQRLVELGISKYSGARPPSLTPGGARQVLVVGQVEDDRSVMSGGGGQTNLELIERARQLEPDSRLIYRPHPDVEAGHRKGHVPDDIARRFADEVERGGSITDLIEAVDEVHCITSLAGFEALLRGKAVTTHGVPFYAGWGLTRDLAPIPARRSRRRSIDELVAATLIEYPRYIDPVTRLPCPPEILVERIAKGEARVDAPYAGMRILQGKLKLAFRRIWEAAA